MGPGICMFSDKSSQAGFSLGRQLHEGGTLAAVLTAKSLVLSTHK